jgi:cytochrome P450
MEYSPFLPEVKEDPYPYYADLRQQAPAYQIPDIGLWAVSRYDDVLYVQHPGDNLVSDLVRAEEENQTLTADEVLTMAVFLLLAGNETTTNLIGSAVVALLEHPQQLAQVRANPALIPQAVEETLRYESPIQLIPRQTTQDVEIAGTAIPAGSLVLPLIGSANRDERIFPDPDRFDITRDTEGHIAFSFGIHYCLGAQLARLEGRIALQALLARFSHLARRDDHVTLVESAFVRGPKTLPLTFA